MVISFWGKTLGKVPSSEETPKANIPKLLKNWVDNQ